MAELMHFQLWRQNRLGENRNPKKAFEYMQKAAELGDATSQATLGVVYQQGSFDGIVVPKLIDKAKELNQKAAEQGEPRALAIVGEALDESIGKFNEESFRLYSLGAYQGHPLCKINIGETYMHNVSKVPLTNSAAKNAELRKDMILCLYWIGKAYEWEDTIDWMCQRIAGVFRDFGLCREIMA